MSTWLVAGTPTDEPYPCRCPKDEVTAEGKVKHGRCKTSGSPDYICPCWGRTDEHEGMPARCCGRRWIKQQKGEKRDGVGNSSPKL